MYVYLSLVILVVGLVASQILDEHAGTPTLCDLFEPNLIVDAILSNSIEALAGDINLPSVTYLSKLYQMYDGKVTGLESLTRLNEAKSQCVNDFSVIKVSLGTTEPLRGNYKWQKGLLRGHVTVDLEKVVASITISLSVVGIKPYVQLMEVSQVDGVTVRVHGLSVFSGPVSWMTSFVANQFKEQILRRMDTTLLKFTNDEIIRRLIEFDTK